MVRPKTLSASALQVASLCMKRYIAENTKYARGVPNNAAMTGSTCHYALEHFVKETQIDGIVYPDDKERLLFLLKEGYRETFGNANYASNEYLDAEGMILKWLETADFEGRKVISVELKNRYPLALPDGSNLPITYIWDRCDVLDDGTIVVVDYKSNRFNIGEDELHHKIQAKLYALIAQILYPEAPFIRVEFHMLRHGITTTTFTPAENAETWKWLHAEVQRILDTEPDAKPTLNNECNYCVVKSSCSAIRSNIDVGGVFSHEPGELVDLFYELKSQESAAGAAALEIENVLGPLLRPGDGSDNVIEGTTHRAFVEARSARKIDTDMVMRAIEDQPDLVDDYFPRGKMTMGQFDSLLKDTRVTPELRATLRGMVGRKIQQPSIKLEKIYD